ncbi:MAG: SDR family oxidoreductase [Candidatus Lokiarchaeota archaeon]|nr:SDR family oxidoreductase [Candidatus Lokiarchaeota archaeon]
MYKPKALVTGASRGIGHEIAKSLVQEGYEVFGTSRHPDSLSETNKIPGVNFLKMDLLLPKTIDAVIAQLGSLDLLINNAGYSQIGSVEEITFDRIQEIFDANLFSQIRLIKGFIPKMREKQQGVIINITSMAGTNPMPFSTIYAASKAAFDKFTQGLRNELAKYHIMVIAIAPLYANTSITQNLDYNKDSPYRVEIEKARASRRRQLTNSVHPKVIAKQVMKILKLKHPKYHYTTGKNAKLMGFFMRYMPQKFIEKMIRKRFELNY